MNVTSHGTRRARRLVGAFAATATVALGTVVPNSPVGASGDEPILIGVNIEQTGPAAVQGEAYARAVDLLAGQINESGGVLGRQIELVVVDNQTDPSEAVIQTQELIDEGVVAMIGPGTSPTTLAAMDTILASGLPTISMGSADVIVDPAGEHPNVFKTPARSALVTEVIAADLAANDIGDIGLIAINNPYGDSGIGAWEALADEGGIELVGVERFEPADTDMSGQINSLLDAGAEAIVTWAIPPGAPTVRRSAVEQVGTDIPMYFDAGAGAELFIELAGGSADGALVAHPPTLIWDEIPENHPQYEALTTFGEAYTGEYGEMSGFAGYAWDALALFAAAIESAGSTEPEAIITALEGLGEYAGVTGTYEITADDHQGLGTDDVLMLTVADGGWDPLNPLAAPSASA